MNKQLHKLEEYKLFYEHLPVPKGNRNSTAQRIQKRTLRRPVKQPANILDNLK